MEKLKTTRWDMSEYLTTDAHIAAYLAAAFEEGDPAAIVQAVGNVARAKGMSEVAETAGVSRTSLYKALSDDARPEFATVMKVITALGVQLHATPVKMAAKAGAKPRRRSPVKAA